MADITLDEFSTELVIAENELHSSRKDPNCKSGLRKVSYIVQQYVTITITGTIFLDPKERLGYQPRISVTASEVRFRIKPDSYKEGECFE